MLERVDVRQAETTAVKHQTLAYTTGTPIPGNEVHKRPNTVFICEGGAGMRPRTARRVDD
jgi:hypothetical protein